jgi:hypothetical protein
MNACSTSMLDSGIRSFLTPYEMKRDCGETAHNTAEDRVWSFWNLCFWNGALHFVRCDRRQNSTRSDRVRAGILGPGTDSWGIDLRPSYGITSMGNKESVEKHGALRCRETVILSTMLSISRLPTRYPKGEKETSRLYSYLCLAHIRPTCIFFEC